MVVKSVNDSIGPDGLVPTLLVYGALPRLGFPTDRPTPPTFQRAVALRKATEAMTKHFAKTQVSSAVRTRNGPDTSDIHTAPIDSHVLFYRSELDRWDGPYALLEIKWKTCTVLLPPPSVPKEFLSTVVKRFIPEIGNESTPSQPNNLVQGPPEVLTFTVQSQVDTSDDEVQPMTFEEILIYSASVIQQSKDHKKYAASRRK